MNLLITGANGFIGKALTARLLASAPRQAGPLRPQHITLLDLSLDQPSAGQVRSLTGSLTDSSTLSKAFDRAVDVVFHLASVPAGMAELQYELGRQVNLDATVALLEAASRSRTGSRPPVFVFASSIAVLGADLPEEVDDFTPPRPRMTYGAHKLIGEILVEDFDRRDRVQGRSLRLPGIVARPPQRTGQLSAFMSDIIRELASGRRYDCPVATHSTTWLMSIQCVVDNLLHAAVLRAQECGNARTWTLPALRASMSELVDALAVVHGPQVREQVTFQSNPVLEASFGRYPPLHTPAAESVGFRNDGDLPTLVRRALAAA